MRPISRRTVLSMMASAAGVAALNPILERRAVWADPIPDIDARVVAVDIPGASTISQVGTFLAGPLGSPIPTNFPAFIQPGAVLDPIRILVGSPSNFGAPLASDVGEEGAFLSIDPSGSEILSVPSAFASDGTQASILNGHVQMYSANSPSWLNNVNNPGAFTAAYAGVSNPLGMSINNAFGRLWPANSPFGQSGVGSSSILDPNGLPLHNPPDPRIGGVYVGSLTDRDTVASASSAAGHLGLAERGGSGDGLPRPITRWLRQGGILRCDRRRRHRAGAHPQGT